MILNKYKNELWHRCMQSEWPNLAEYLRRANNFLEMGYHNESALNLRTFFEKSIDYIGERENIKSLREENTKEKIEYNPLKRKLDTMKKINFIDINTYNHLQRVRAELNPMVHDKRREVDEYEYEYTLPIYFQETIIFAKWFISKYTDLEKFKKELEENKSDDIDDIKSNIKRIKYCQNVSQCGRNFGENYEFDICVRCGFPVVEKYIEDNEYNNEKIENYAKEDVQDKHFLFIGELFIKKSKVDGEYVIESEDGVVKSQMELIADELVLGRKSTSGDYSPDIDFGLYIEGSDRSNKVSKRHALVYKEKDSYYVKNISKGNYIIVEDKEQSTEESIVEKYLEGNDVMKLEDNDVVKISDVGFIQYIKR